jgi:perosamine synthetase
MITTNDPRHASRLRLLRQHGMSVPDSVRHNSTQVIAERYVCLGYNYRMTDVQAAIGVEQMKKLEGLVARRRELAAKYTAALADHPWLRPPYVPEDVEANFQSYAVQLSTDAPLGRDELMQKLLDRGIATRRGVMLSHREPAYSGFARGPELPCSERASNRSLLLPFYPQMTEEELAEVVRALEELASV